jgi:hypothetical protein
MARLEELVRTHKNGVMVSGFTVHETAMSDCIFTLGGAEPCIRQSYPAAFRLILQLEGPYALPPDRVKNSTELSFLTEEEFRAACADLSGLLDGAGPVDEAARERFIREWRKKNRTKRG